MQLRLCMTAIFFTVVPAVSGQETGRRYALLVGVAQYAPEMDDLRYTEKDVEKLAEVLQSKPKPYTRIVVMTQTRGKKDPNLMPTAANIRKQLDKLTAACEKEDVLLVAMTGHGIEPKGKAFFCGHKAKVAEAETLLPLDDVYASLKESAAGLKVLVMDACREDSGKGIKLKVGKEQGYPDPVTTTASPAGVVTLFACSPRERSYESDELKHGVFFDSLIKGLAGAAARPGEESIGWVSLAAYTQSSVLNQCKKEGKKQKPHFKGDSNSALALMVLPPGLKTLVENFRRVKLGEVPTGWERDDAVAVRAHQGAKCLEADTKGTHSATTPKLRIEGDFIVDVDFQTTLENSLLLTLQGKDGDPSLELIVQPPKAPGGGFIAERKACLSTLKLADVESTATVQVATPHPVMPFAFQPVRVRLRLEREGTTFRVLANGETLIARPLKDYKDFDRIKIALTMNKEAAARAEYGHTRVFAIGVAPRPKSTKKE